MIFSANGKSLKHGKLQLYVTYLHVKMFIFYKT